MSEDSIYKDADIVWVKLGTSWWPGEVYGHQRQPAGFLQQAKRKPYCVVKFFQEDSFEYVKSSKHILHFNCSKKDEFIRKGHELFKAKKKFMENFPSDVSTAERLTRSVTRSSLFFNSRPDSIVKAILGESPAHKQYIQNGGRSDNVTKIINITPNRKSEASSSSSNSPPTYKCSMCDFQSTRQNVMVLHRKSHSNSSITPSSRSSLVNSAAMNLLSEIITQKKSAIKTVPVETSTVKTIVKHRPVRRQSNAMLSNETIVVITDQSDNSSEENFITQKKCDISGGHRKGDLSVKQSDIKKVLHTNSAFKEDDSTKTNAVVKSNTLKAEDIKKSLLADWIDEDKDDEEENEVDHAKGEQNADYTEVIPKANLNFNARGSVLTTVPLEKLQIIEPAQNECFTTSDCQKPSPKIRNIPKKDRRNIVFTDFNNSEPFNVDTLLQQTSEDACRQKSSMEAGSPATEQSATEQCSVKLCFVKPSTEDTSNTKAVEPTNAAEHKAGLTTAEPFTVKPFNIDVPKFKKSIEKSYTGEAATKPIEESEPPSEISCIEETTITDANKLNKINEKTYTVEAATVKPCIEKVELCDTPKFKKSIEKSYTVEATKKLFIEETEQFAENSYIKETANIDVSKFKKSIEKSYTVEAAKIPFIVENQLSADNSCIKETSNINISKFKKSIETSYTVEVAEQPFIEETELSAENSCIKETASIDSSKFKNSIKKSYTVEVDKVIPCIEVIDSSAVNSCIEGNSGVESSTSEADPERSLVEPTIFKRYTRKSARVKSSKIKSGTVSESSVAPSAIKSCYLEPSIVVLSTLELPKLDIVIKESKTMEKAAVEYPTVVVETFTDLNSAVDISPKKTLTVEAPTVALSSEDPSTRGTSIIEPLNVESSTVDPFNRNTSIEKPITVELSTIDAFTPATSNKSPSVESVVVSSPTKNLSMEERLALETSTTTLSSVGPFPRDKSTKEPPRNSSMGEQLTVETSTVLSTVGPSTRKKSTRGGTVSTTEPPSLESFLVDPAYNRNTFTIEPPTEKSFAVETSIKKRTNRRKKVPVVKSSHVEPFSTAHSIVEPPIIESSPLDTSTRKNSVVEPPTIEPFAADTSTALKSTIEQISLDPSARKASPTELSPVYRFDKKASAMDPPTLEPFAVDPSARKASTTESPTMEQSFVDPSVEEESTTELPIMESSAGETSAIQNSTLELLPGDPYLPTESRTEPPTMESSAWDISAGQKSIEQITVNPSVRKSSAMEPFKESPILESRAEDQSSCEKSTMEPPAIELYKVEQSREEQTSAKTSTEQSSADTVNINKSIIELAIFETHSGEQSTVELFSKEPSVLESPTKEPSLTRESLCTEPSTEIEPDTESPTVESVNKNLASVELSTASKEETFPKLSPLKLSATEQCVQKPCKESSFNVEPSIEEEFTVKLTALESSSVDLYVEPSTAKLPVAESSNDPVSVEDPTPIEKIQITEPKTLNSVTKSSLSCFDFEEEEDSDILTSIAKFKKKYVSPEKNYDFGKIQTRIPDTQKLEMELKDKQLSAEIESLLKTTELPIELATPSSMTERSISYDVRGLPIKERGKRIFKSRNRFRAENSYSISTTSTAKVVTETTPQATKKMNRRKTSSSETRNAEQSRDAMKMDQIDDKLSSQIRLKNDESSIDDIPRQNMEETMDDKVTNSEEEIVGRVVFSPAEVYAPSAENCLTESLDNRESHVSSSVMDVLTESVNVSEERAETTESNFDNYTENDLENSAIEVNECQTELTYSCDIDQNGQSKYIFSFPQSEQIDDQQEFLQQEIQEDQLNTFFVVEENEPIYEVEIYDGEGNSKLSNSNDEISDEYELITTEVTSIVDRIADDPEENISVAKSNELESVTEASEVVTCSVDGNLLSQKIHTNLVQLPIPRTDDNITESQECSSPLGVENDNNFYVTIKDLEATEPDGNIASDESNTGSTMETRPKNYYIQKGILVESLENESVHTEVERTENSSDDTSTVISDAEAEFGSPTSMLDEERVLNRGRSGSETPSINIECISNVPKSRTCKEKVLKKPAHMTRYQFQRKNKRLLLFKCLQDDTQESVSNDVEQNSSSVLTEEDHKTENKKEKEEEPKPKQEKHIREQKADNVPDVLETNVESDDEEDEEICSPPMEPLVDTSKVEETIESTTNKLLDKQDQCFEKEFIIQKSNQPEIEGEETLDSVFISESSDKNKLGETLIKNDRSEETTSENKDTQPHKLTSEYYTVTQKTDTIIRLNKYKETSAVTDESSNELKAPQVDAEKSDIAGEELSAAEALLLIPNQPNEMMDKSNNLVIPTPTTTESSVSNENSVSFMLTQEIKEEPLDNIQTTEQSQQDEIPREIIRRKRRSHMKVTPRKRVIDVLKVEKSMEVSSAHVEAKIPKLMEDPDEKTFAEQYEENFVLKYTKEQSIEEIDAAESAGGSSMEPDKSSNLGEKSTPEKVHISVDISNPLSSQIASILGSHRPSITEVTNRNVAKKRKQTLEDDIPSFIIKRPSPKTVAEAEAADRETIAQIQNLCPHVEITRKSSKDDQSGMNMPTTSLKPQIINQQILRTGNQPIVTVTAKSKKPEEGIFDISNMPIVLSNEAIMNDKLHLVITPTSNPEVIKQFQNQQQLLLNSGTSAVDYTSAVVTTSNPGIPNRRPSNVRTKRTPSRQQLQEQQNQGQQKQQKQQQHNQQKHNQETENQLQQNQYHQQNQHHQQQTVHHQQNQHESQNHHQHQFQQQIQLQQNLQQQYHQQQQLLQQQHHEQQQHHQMLDQEQHQRQHQQLQLHSQPPHFQQHQHFQHQFQLHHQNQIQHQIQEEQQILIHQQHQQQLMLQHQLQMHQNQSQQHQIQQVAHTSSSEKQMGIDTRGNKYVIIKAPSNTVVMGNNSESHNSMQRSIQQQQMSDNCHTNTKRKQRHSAGTSKKSLALQTPLPVKSPALHQLPPYVQSTIAHLPPLPNQTSLHHQQSHQNFVQTRENCSNEIQQHLQFQQIAPPSILDFPTTTTKSKGRGRRPKQTKKAATAKESKAKSSNQRSTRSMEWNKKNNLMTSSEVKKSVATDFIPPPTYTTTQHQSPSVVFMTTTQPTTTSCSPVLCTNNMPFQMEITPSLSQRSEPRIITGISLETSDGSGVGYAVPSLPVPGYPQTFLLCELIDKKYKEVYSKPLYLSPDRTRFFEVPDELVTEAHRKLTDCRREPNPDVLQVVSDGILQVLQPRIIEINTETIVDQMQQQEQNLQQVNLDKNVKPNEDLMQKHDQLSVEEQASALLCLQEQIVQEQIAQETLAQKQQAQEQLVREQLVQEQLVQEQFVQEQLVQEQLVQEQFVQEQFVQEQFGQEQFVQEQFVQEQFVQEQFGQEQFVQEQFVQDQFVQEQFVQEQSNEGEHGIIQIATVETEEVQDNSTQQLEESSGQGEKEPEQKSPMLVINIGNQHVVLPQNDFLDLIGQQDEAEKSAYTLSPAVITELLNRERKRLAALAAAGQQQIVVDESIIQTGDSSSNILALSLDDSGLYTEEQFINSSDILHIDAEGLRLIGSAGENANIVFQPITTIPTNESESNVTNQSTDMSTVEIVSNKNESKFEADASTIATLQDCLNVIGVSGQDPNVPISHELPTSVANSASMTSTRTPTPGTITMNEIIATGLCHHPDITSLPSMGSNEQELHYEFFTSATVSPDDKVNENEESVIADMGEYAIVSSGENFDDPGR